MTENDRPPFLTVCLDMSDGLYHEIADLGRRYDLSPEDVLLLAIAAAAGDRRFHSQLQYLRYGRRLGELESPDHVFTNVRAVGGGPVHIAEQLLPHGDVKTRCSGLIYRRDLLWTGLPADCPLCKGMEKSE